MIVTVIKLSSATLANKSAHQFYYYRMFRESDGSNSFPIVALFFNLFKLIPQACSETLIVHRKLV